MFLIGMDKRGQFYIIIAIIISLAFFSIITPQNRMEESILFQDFNDVSLNYVEEAPKVANYGIFNDLNINSLLSDFTKDFLTFAKQRNPTVELIYVYNNGTNVNMKSYLDETTIVESNETTFNLLGAEESTINNVNLNIAGKDFTQQIPLQIKNFGDEFSSVDFPSSKNIILNVGGIIHNFDLSSQGPELKVLIRSKTGSIVQIYKTGSSQIFPVTF